MIGYFNTSDRSWNNDHMHASYWGVWNSDPLYSSHSIASYMGVWNSETPVFYCELYGCLDFRHPYILLRAIRMSELQTPLYFIASYMGV
jgi:hypothetical protein